MSEVKPTILNVDDNEASRYAISRILKQAGFTVKEAATGQEALQLAQEQPDLVILDVHLPDMLGFEVCQRIKKTPTTARIPVLMVSATYVTSQSVVTGLTEGADGYLHERVDPPVLIAYVQALLRIRQAEIEQARLLRDNQQQRALLERLVNSVPAAIAILQGPEYRYILANPEYHKLGWGKGELVGRTITESWPEAASQVLPLLDRVYQTGEPYHAVDAPFCVERETGSEEVFFTFSYLRLADEQGRPEGILVLAQETTPQVRAHQQLAEANEQLKLSLQEKEVLLKEVHHRVKNNLQAISNLLYMQSIYAKDETIQEMFRQSQDRIKSIALIHEKLYKTPDLAHLNFAEYIKSLAQHLIRSYRVDPTAVTLRIKTDGVDLDIDIAVPLGIIINELVSNSLKYAFLWDTNEPKKKCEIYIELNRGANPEELVLIVGDNGIGLPDDIDVSKMASLGLKLVYNLTAHMRGTIEIHRNSGTEYVIKFAPDPLLKVG